MVIIITVVHQISSFEKQILITSRYVSSSYAVLTTDTQQSKGFLSSLKDVRILSDRVEEN